MTQGSLTQGLQARRGVTADRFSHLRDHFAAQGGQREARVGPGDDGSGRHGCVAASTGRRLVCGSSEVTPLRCLLRGGSLR